MYSVTVVRLVPGILSSGALHVEFLGCKTESLIFTPYQTTGQLYLNDYVPT